MLKACECPKFWSQHAGLHCSCFNSTVIVKACQLLIIVSFIYDFFN